MIRYALKNLWTQPVRSALCIVGISIAIVGVVCIFSFSAGVKSTVNSAIHLVDGVVILEKNQPRPSLSSVPVRLEQTLEQSDRIGNVVPWIWTIPGSVNNEPLIRRDLMMPELLGGVDVDDLQHQQHPHLYQRTLVSGRFLTTGDQRKIVISELLSDRHDVQVGEDLPIDGTSYEVIGLYNTGNQIMNMAIVLPMSEARSKRNLSDDHVSDLYVEPVEGMSREELIDQIESVLLADDKRALEKWDVRSRTEWEGDFSDMMNEVDTLLFLISSLAVIVGTVGIINTMLMSITERTSEFGILIANGWSRSNIVQLVLLESTILGIISGVTGIGIGWVAVKVVDRMLDLTIQSATPLSLLSYCFLVAVFIGILGGVYPAYRAAKKHPIDAIRSVR
jgi:putative ABC transport system permease protein